MRLRPVAPLLFLEANEDVMIHNLQIPAGTTIFLATRPGAIGEANFTDAQAFYPERWLPAMKRANNCPFHHEATQQQTGADEPAASLVHNRQAHIPFGHGPRLCPGRSLALLEMKLTMAMLCRHFDVRAAIDLAEVEEVWAFAMMPKGLTVHLHPWR